MEQKQAEKQDFKYLVRIANTDLNGNEGIYSALINIQGINFMCANAICFIAKVDRAKKVGTLSDEMIVKIDDITKDLAKFNVPKWLLNRRSDPDDGVSRHIITSNMKFITDNDIKMMKKIKSYKGLRHMSGLTVRGQRTRSNFRRNKGKVKLGVSTAGAKKGGKV